MLEKLREEVRKRMREKRYIHTLGCGGKSGRIGSKIWS